MPPPATLGGPRTVTTPPKPRATGRRKPITPPPPKLSATRRESRSCRRRGRAWQADEAGHATISQAALARHSAGEPACRPRRPLSDPRHQAPARTSAVGVPRPAPTPSAFVLMPTPPRLRPPSTTRSGARIFATWGANAGEATITSLVGPSATISPSAMTTTRWATVATNSTSWVASSYRVALRGQLSQGRREAPFRVVVQAARGLVQEHDRRGRRQLDRQHQRQSLPFGQVAGVRFTGDPGGQPVQQRPGRARRDLRIRCRPVRTRRRPNRGTAGRPGSAGPARRADGPLVA